MSPSFALYIHVPFCEKRCIYCDFYSTTSGSEVRQRYVEALCRELITQRELMGAGEVKEHLLRWWNTFATLYRRIGTNLSNHQVALYS